MGKLILTRRHGERIQMTVRGDTDPAELVRQLTTAGIWIELQRTKCPGQFRVVLVAPPAISVVREELMGRCPELEPA